LDNTNKSSSSLQADHQYDKSISSCIVCQSTNIQEAIRVADHLVSQQCYIIDECQSCGFRYINNPPLETEAAKYYATEEYIEHSDASDGLINTVYHKARRWMLHHKHDMIRKLNRPTKLLDFGTGTGYFLQYMKSKGYAVTGVEISEKARTFGQKEFGLDIRHPDRLFDKDIGEGFGYVTFWHVLEHVYAPEKMLKKLHDIISPDGVVIVALPNYHCVEEGFYKAYWNGYDVPRHLWHWDKKSFTLFAEMCGYHVMKTKILPLDPFYNCLISESYRKKKWAHILIPFIGIASLVRGWMDHGQASSIVYFLEKKK
jgi:2-polyprenyl-3-methyl-5-hydroxy-6-metoxy-1,4-benzoquinol methylase